jgi:futalosine hydrolase
LGDHLPVGAAYGFDRVVSYQIGVGEADLFRGGGELGWSQWAPGDIADSLDLSVGEGLANAGTLLTCCAASANAAEADRKAARHPDARAEDMEAFGVALAARLAGLPVEIIRGVSNRAGDRDKDNWRIDEALTAAAELAASAIACYSDSSN